MHMLTHLALMFNIFVLRWEPDFLFIAAINRCDSLVRCNMPPKIISKILLTLLAALKGYSPDILPANMPLLAFITACLLLCFPNMYWIQEKSADTLKKYLKFHWVWDSCPFCVQLPKALCTEHENCSLPGFWELIMLIMHMDWVSNFLNGHISCRSFTCEDFIVLGYVFFPCQCARMWLAYLPNSMKKF